jgi:cell division protease FtsH
MNEAAILSIRMKATTITLDILDEAIDRVIGGPSKLHNTMSDEEKNLIAHHEAGHAIIGLVDDNAEKVQKISIVPRGAAGGYVLMTPKKEKIVQTKAELMSKITSYMGGRVSEEIFFGKDNITTGAYSDIQEATKIARRMVTEFGMSELGPIQYEKAQGSVFLGRDFSSEKTSSSQVQYEIDQQVRKIIMQAYDQALAIINKNKPLITLFAEALMIKETLNAEETEYIFEHKELTEQIKQMKERASAETKDTTKK